MHKNCHKSYLDSEPALHKCRVDTFLEVLFAASPEGVKRIYRRSSIGRLFQRTDPE